MSSTPVNLPSLLLLAALVISTFAVFAASCLTGAYLYAKGVAGKSPMPSISIPKFKRARAAAAEEPAAKPLPMPRV